MKQDEHDRECEAFWRDEGECSCKGLRAARYIDEVEEGIRDDVPEPISVRPLMALTILDPDDLTFTIDASDEITIVVDPEAIPKPGEPWRELRYRKS